MGGHDFILSKISQRAKHRQSDDTKLDTSQTVLYYTLETTE